jgi:hypothetical protein
MGDTLCERCGVLVWDAGDALCPGARTSPDPWCPGTCDFDAQDDAEPHRVSECGGPWGEPEPPSSCADRKARRTSSRPVSAWPCPECNAPSGERCASSVEDRVRHGLQTGDISASSARAWRARHPGTTDAARRTHEVLDLAGAPRHVPHEPQSCAERMAPIVGATCSDVERRDSTRCEECNAEPGEPCADPLNQRILRGLTTGDISPNAARAWQQRHTGTPDARRRTHELLDMAGVPRHLGQQEQSATPWSCQERMTTRQPSGILPWIGWACLECNARAGDACASPLEDRIDHYASRITDSAKQAGIIRYWTAFARERGRPVVHYEMDKRNVPPHLNPGGEGDDDPSAGNTVCVGPSRERDGLAACEAFCGVAGGFGGLWGALVHPCHHPDRGYPATAEHDPEQHRPARRPPTRGQIDRNDRRSPPHPPS